MAEGVAGALCSTSCMLVEAEMKVLEEDCGIASGCKRESEMCTWVLEGGGSV